MAEVKKISLKYVVLVFADSKISWAVELIVMNIRNTVMYFIFDSLYLQELRKSLQNKEG